MLDVAVEALKIILDPTRISFMLLGIVIGSVIGVLPGLGGTVGMAIVLPFVFGMDPFTGMALLIGMTAVIHTADTFPSVLLGIPGSAGSQATIMDGFPLAKKGEGARALGAGFMVVNWWSIGWIGVVYCYSHCQTPYIKFRLTRIINAFTVGIKYGWNFIRKESSDWNCSRIIWSGSWQCWCSSFCY